jgi:sialic acid synthase SpsE
MQNKFLNFSNLSRPYFIAEIGVNHEGSMLRAKKLIDHAKEGGADAVKFQTYKAEKIAIRESPYYWDIKKEKTKTQFDLFSKYDKFDYKHYKSLSLYCKKKKIEFLSTPFDLEAVNFLSPLVRMFKISSSDITNLPLLEAVASKKKTTILSTGASSISEIKQAVKILSKKVNKIILMHCILNYPTTDKDANLNMIKSLQLEFPQCISGYSDHTLPLNNMQNLITAYLFGAKVIEKHFTLDKTQKGNDHYHSLNKSDLKEYLKKTKSIYATLGLSEKKFLRSEIKSRKNARRSIVINKTILVIWILI